jgi:hypothetical protein
VLIKVLVLSQEKFLRNLRVIDDKGYSGAENQADNGRDLFFSSEVRIFKELVDGMSQSLDPLPLSRPVFHES